MDKYEIPDDIVTNSGGDLEDIPYPDTPSEEGSNDTYGHARDLLEFAKQELMVRYNLFRAYGNIDWVKEKIYYGY